MVIWGGLTSSLYLGSHDQLLKNLLHLPLVELRTKRLFDKPLTVTISVPRLSDRGVGNTYQKSLKFGWK